MLPTILMIEDNPLNMRLVRRLLQDAGYQMIEANTGLRGLEIATAQVPDLILVDVNLPDIDGLEVTRRLRSIHAVQHIPIVALTANSMYGDRERCLEAGCDGYLSKPVARLELRTLLSYFLTDQSHK